MEEDDGREMERVQGGVKRGLRDLCTEREGNAVLLKIAAMEAIGGRGREREEERKWLAPW